MMDQPISRLTNVDIILLILVGGEGRMRRCEIMRRFREIRGRSLAPIYFARYKQQSPFYAFCKRTSVYKSGNSSYGHRRENDAKVAVWKLTERGWLRALELTASLTRDTVAALTCAN